MPSFKDTVFLDAYLFNNLGDDLFVDLLIQRYPDIHFTILSHMYQNPAGNITIRRHKLLRRMIKKSLQNHYANASRAVITIGGSMYMEPGDKPACLFQPRVPYYIIGINFGPWHSQGYFQQAQALFGQSRDVCFRDQASWQLFAHLPQARLAPDLLFAWPFAQVQAKKQVCISLMDVSVNQEAYYQLLKDLAEKRHAAGYKIVLASFCQIQKDEAACLKLAGMLDFDVSFAFYTGERKDMLETLQESEVIIATRFHAAVLGLAAGRKVMSIAYSDKTAHVLDDLGFAGQYLPLEKLTPKSQPVYIELDAAKRAQLARDAQGHFALLDKELAHV